LAYEVIIVDDGSTDATPSISQNFVHTYANVFRFVRQNHRELAAAKNLGIRSSVGEFLIFLDDDAIAPTDFLDKINSIVSTKHIDVLGFMDLPLKTESYLSKGVRHLENFSRRFLVKDVRLRIKAHIVVKRAILQKAGLFDESRGYRKAEDTEMNYRLAKVTPNISFSDAVYVYHRAPTFQSFLRRSYSKLTNPKMLDVPNPFQYYNVRLGMVFTIFLLILASVIRTWYFAVVFLAAVFGLISFSFVVSATTSKTVRYGPAVFVVSSFRMLFLVLYSLRFAAEQVRRSIRPS
jgi:glycosyltransferase involved in cell wall biosynthesis